MPRRPYFAQNDILDATGHRASYFETQDQARAFLQQHGGGTIKDRRRQFAVIETVEPLADINERVDEILFGNRGDDEKQRALLELARRQAECR